MTAGEGGKTPAWLAGVDPVSICSEDKQRRLLKEYVDMLARLNRRINLVSRESSDHLWTRHVVHSLFLGSRRFAPGATVVDWGTGGGLPLVPLAIAFPDVRFVGVDSIEKKVLAVRSMIRKLGLDNADVWCGRAEEWPDETDYSVSRATAPLIDLWHWHRRAATGGVRQDESDRFWSRGLVCLKGGNLTREIAALQSAWPNANVREIPLDPLVYGGQFADKSIVTVSLS